MRSGEDVGEWVFLRGGWWVMVGGCASAEWGRGAAWEACEGNMHQYQPTHPRTTSNRADPHTQFVGTHRSTKQPHTPQ